MTLAMNQPLEKSPAASSSGLTPNNDSALINPKDSQPGSFPLIREDSHPNKPVSVQVGYGRIWDDQSTLQKICSDHQEPGCAYVSARFSF
jgi:hypothetical protein